MVPKLEMVVEIELCDLGLIQFLTRSNLHVLDSPRRISVHFERNFQVLRSSWWGFLCSRTLDVLFRMLQHNLQSDLSFWNRSIFVINSPGLLKLAFTYLQIWKNYHKGTFLCSFHPTNFQNGISTFVARRAKVFTILEDADFKYWLVFLFWSSRTPHQPTPST